MNVNDLEQLDYYALSVMDNGIPNQMLKNELRKLTLDLVDRKGDASAREINIKLTLKPTLDPAGQLTHIKAELDIKAKVPPYRTETYQLAADPAKGLFVNLEFPKQIDQRSLFGSMTTDDVDHKDLK